METVVHRAESRGQYNYGWLNTKHTFSFARYYDPHRINFGALRVLNDDVVKPGKGFDEHPHDNMEIISIPVSGQLLHKDSKNHSQSIRVNEVQVMSAGNGIFHSEYNGSTSEEVNFLQIWIYPAKKNVVPSYSQKYYDPKEAKNNWQLLVAPSNGETLKINQQAYISRIFLDPGEKVNYTLNQESYGSYLFTIEGSFKINNTIVQHRDGIGIFESGSFTLEALDPLYLLNIEIPEFNQKLNK